MSDKPTAEALLMQQGVFKGMHGLRAFVNASAFWEAQLYGTRLYYGPGGLDYLHHSVVRAAVAALDESAEKIAASAAYAEQSSALLTEAAQALDDWIATFASEHCSEAIVKAAWVRIREGGGTLAYAGVLRARCIALAKNPNPVCPHGNGPHEKCSVCSPGVGNEALPPVVHVCHGLDTPERVCFYEQDFYVLSNFSAFNVEVYGHQYQTSEHAYHAQKFRDGGDLQREVMFAPSAHVAFKIAELNKRRRRFDWDAVKVDIMRDILRAKAAQHEYVRRKLLATGERELVENSWRDDFWGWGPNRDGKNMLGRLWMEVRAETRNAAGTATETKA